MNTNKLSNFIDKLFILWRNFRKPKNILQVAMAGKVSDHLVSLHKLLFPLEVWKQEEIKGAIWDYATEKGRGDVLNLGFRFALTGKKKSPNGLEVAEVIGKEETLLRLKNYYFYLVKEFGGGWDVYSDYSWGK